MRVVAFYPRSMGKRRSFHPILPGNARDGRWLILGFGVVARRSGDQGTDERSEKLFAPFAGIVNKLEEPKIDRKLFL